MRRRLFPVQASLVMVAAVSVSPSAHANHGPGTSGGGSSTASGETLKSKAWDLSFRMDYTEFENISREEAERRAEESGEFDALSHSTLTTVSLGYGVTDDFQLGAQIGYYWGDNFVDAEFDEDEGAESAGVDPDGLTDLWLNVKYRFLKGAPGNLSAIAGIKLPTGRDDVRLDNGEELEPSSQPGSGSIDFQAGVAYSRFLTSHLTLDTSAVYTFRTEHDDFQVGDRLDLGLALAYRLTDSIQSFPTISVFGEVTGIILQKDREDGDSNPNSGGNTIYLSPGVRVRFSPNVALTAAPAFPVLQDLNGDQIEADFKFAATLGFSF